MTPRVDHAIVGAGLAGLVLARELLRRSRHDRLLVADPVAHLAGPITFAWWSTGDCLLDRWAVRTWDRVRVVAPDGRPLELALGGWRYTAVSWDRARADLLAEVATDPRVEFVPAAVTRFEESGDRALVPVDGQVVAATWVYDSRPPDCVDGALWQGFQGLWVEGSGIEDSAPTLMDLSTDAGHGLEFSYTLPVDPTRAMVMAVRMSRSAPSPDPVPAVRRAVGSSRWRAVARESGTTLLAVAPRRRRTGRRTLAVGARGGRVRPSTGYGVTRICRDAEAICSSLERNGHPFEIPTDRPVDRALDRVWLRALDRDPDRVRAALFSLFERVPIERVLQFLDGAAAPGDIALIVRSLPPGPFVRAALMPVR